MQSPNRRPLFITIILGVALTVVLSRKTDVLSSAVTTPGQSLAGGRPTSSSAPTAFEGTPTAPHAEAEISGSTSAKGKNDAQQQAFQALPKTEQESLWAAFAAARRAVQPLTDHEAALPHNKGVRYFAQNPGQQLTARFLDGAARIESGRGSQWAATLSIAGEHPTQPVLTQGRVEYRHASGITESYENRAGGIEHVFKVSRRLDEAASELRMPLTLQGAEARHGSGDQAGTLTFTDPATQSAVLSYGALKVWDATGSELAAHYETRPQGMDIVVADAGASYPITIDPLIATLEAKLGPEVTGDGKEEDFFGFRVAVDGDTALISAPYDDTGVGTNSGSA